MLGFKCVPVSLKYSPVMANLTSFERDVVWSAQLGQDVRHCLPMDAATLRSVIFPTRPFVAIREIAAARDKLVALGVFIRKATHRKEWLEIHPGFRHSEGQNETSFGDIDAPQDQAELPFGPVAMSFPPAQKPPKSRRGQKSNRLRVDSEQNRTETDSTPAHAEPEPAPVPPTPGNRENRDLRLGNDPRFARGKEDEQDPLWDELLRILPPSEMIRYGALWAKRLRLCRDALNTAVSDWRALTPETKNQWKPAAYITTAFENEKRRFGT